MKIAIYQTESTVENIEENLIRMQSVARQAALEGAHLLIFPELFLTGYNIGDATIELAQAVDGAATRKAAAIAKENGIALLYGYPERWGGNIYNAAVLIDSNGEILANYRKAHLFGTEENRLFQKGDALVAVELGGIKIGLLICYDVEFPEAVRALADAGVELVAVPTALMQPYCRIARTVVPARAYESQVYLAYVNRCGREGELQYCGQSCVIGPDGNDISRAGQAAELLYATIDRTVLHQERKQNPVLRDRRPGLYASAVQSGKPVKT
jgi:5-aminopentanamidase